MIKFDVLNRFTGAVQFTAEIDCDESASHSFKLGLAVKWAVKNDADLTRANLNGADLTWANLTWADLTWANLTWANLNGADLTWANLTKATLNRANLNGANLTRANLNRASLDGANLNGASGVNDYVKCIQIDTYPIAYTDTMMQIGCEHHAIEDWRGFDGKRILEMDGKKALKFWPKYKDWIFQTIELCPAKPTGWKDTQ